MTCAVVAVPMSAASRTASRSSSERGVDLAGEGDDGADGLGEGLAGARDRLLHAVEEAELGSAGGMVSARGAGSGTVGGSGSGVRLPKRGEGHVRS